MVNQINGWENTYNGQSFKVWSKGDKFLWLERLYHESYQVSTEIDNEPMSLTYLGVFTEGEAQDIARKYMEEN